MNEQTPREERTNSRLNLFSRAHRWLRQFRVQLAIVILFMSIAPCGVLIYYNFYTSRDALIRDRINSSVAWTILGLQDVRSRIERVLEDLTFLSKIASQASKEKCDDPKKTPAQCVRGKVEQFLQFLKSRGVYARVDFYDENLRGLFAVLLGPGGMKDVPAEDISKLNVKAETIAKLPPGVVFRSQVRVIQLPTSDASARVVSYMATMSLPGGRKGIAVLSAFAEAILAPTTLQWDPRAMLVEPSGYYVFHHDARKVRTPGGPVEKGMSIFDDYKSEICSEILSGRFGLYVDEKTGRVIIHAPIRFLPTAGGPFFTLVHETDPATMQGAFARMKRLSVEILVGAFIFAVTLSVLLANALAKPLGRLKDAAARLGQGDLSTRATINGPDEIEELAHSFNHMASELQGLYETLEQRVADRTAELREALRELSEQREAIQRANAQLAHQAEMLQKEARYAGEIQRRLMPRDLPRFDKVKFHAEYLTYSEAGGDYYTIVRLNDRECGVFVGDVSGHDLRSAMITVLLKSMIDYEAKEVRDGKIVARAPGELISTINEHLCKENIESLFVSAFYGVLDVSSLEFRYCNAGHPSPFYFDKEGDVHALAPTGMVLGVSGSTCFEEKTILLDSPSHIILYTDGLLEMICGLGNQRAVTVHELQGRLSALSKGLRAKDVVDRIMRCVNEHIEARQCEDDMTLVTIQVEPEVVGYGRDI